jgi:hypothetical protein
MLLPSVIYAECHSYANYPECHYAECHCSECRGAMQPLPGQPLPCFRPPSLFPSVLFRQTSSGRRQPQPRPNFIKLFMAVPFAREYQKGKYHCTLDLLFDWF